MATSKKVDPLHHPSHSPKPHLNAWSPSTPRSELCQIQKSVKEMPKLKDVWKTNNLIEKMGKEYGLQENKIQMDLNLAGGEKKRSTALIKEMQIETNWDTNFHLSDWQRSKSLITHRVGEDVSFIEGVNRYNLLERITCNVYQYHRCIDAFTSHSTFKNLFCRHTPTCAKWCVYKDTHCSRICHDNRMETVPITTVRGLL